MRRYLKIAISIAGGCACLVVVVMWVSGQRYLDRATVLIVGTDRAVSLWFVPGGLVASLESESSITIPHNIWINFGDSEPVDESSLRRLLWGNIGFHNGSLYLAYWLCFLLAAAAGAAPWIPWPRRFSLRMMLVVMTLIAIALGVFVSRN